MEQLQPCLVAAAGSMELTKYAPTVVKTFVKKVNLKNATSALFVQDGQTGASTESAATIVTQMVRLHQFTLELAAGLTVLLSNAMTVAKTTVRKLRLRIAMSTFDVPAGETGVTTASAVPHVAQMMKLFRPKLGLDVGLTELKRAAAAVAAQK